MKLAAAVFALAVGGVQAPAQFGLTCSVTYPASGRTSTIPFSIDLDRGVWCWVEDGACWRGEVRSIVRADATTLVLSPVTVIDRTSGSYRDDLAAGTCVRSDYTPIPEAAF